MLYAVLPGKPRLRFVNVEGISPDEGESEDVSLGELELWLKREMRDVCVFGVPLNDEEDEEDEW